MDTSSFTDDANISIVNAHGTYAGYNCDGSKLLATKTAVEYLLSIPML